MKTKLFCFAICFACLCVVGCGDGKKKENEVSKSNQSVSRSEDDVAADSKMTSSKGPRSVDDGNEKSAKKDESPSDPALNGENDVAAKEQKGVEGQSESEEQSNDSKPSVERTADSTSTDGSDKGNKELKTVESQLEKVDPPTEEYEEEVVEIQTIEIPETWKRLSPKHEIWLDTKNKQVIAGGRVCLDRGGLEMFVCPEGTKEHESIVAIRAESFQVHACLIALGINPGKPVDWGPPYKMAKGPKIQISVMWVDDGKLGKDLKNDWDFPEQKQPEKVFPVDSDKIKKIDGRQMVRNAETQKPLDVHWVFGGSITEEFPDGTSHYYGNGGELVCVSNFATATMDLPIKSSQARGNLMFEANTEKIPPRGTKVYVIFEAAKE